MLSDPSVEAKSGGMARPGRWCAGGKVDIALRKLTPISNERQITSIITQSGIQPGGKIYAHVKILPKAVSTTPQISQITPSSVLV